MSLFYFVLPLLFLFSGNPSRADNVLPIDDIFDQGSTQWCWAYSSFHTLRTFYTMMMGADPTVVPGVWDWRDKLRELNSNPAFREFMGKRFNTQRTGNPQEFFALMVKENRELKDAGWKAFYPNGRSVRYEQLEQTERTRATRLSSGSILMKVHTNLQKGIPSVYCNPPHCMMIFGDSDDGTKPSTFEIADSVGSRVHHWSFSKAAQQLDLVVTLP